MSIDEATQAFCTRFPDGGLDWCDFRPHFGGYVVNAYSAILPTQDEASTRKAALVLLGEIASWLQQHSGAFGA